MAANRQTEIHTTSAKFNAVTLVWGSLRLAPIISPPPILVAKPNQQKGGGGGIISSEYGKWVTLHITAYEYLWQPNSGFVIYMSYMLSCNLPRLNKLLNNM